MPAVATAERKALTMHFILSAIVISAGAYMRLTRWDKKPCDHPNINVEQGDIDKVRCARCGCDVDFDEWQQSRWLH